MHRLNVLVAATLLAGGLSFAQEGRFDRTLTVSGPLELDAMTDSGGIVITPGRSGSIHIVGILKGQHGWMNGCSDVESRIRRLEQNPPVVQSGNSIRVGHVANHELRCISMRLEIAAPPQTKLRARADSGGIRVDGIDGPVDIQSDSGGVEARNIGSEVRACTDSGGVRIHDVHGPVYARADSGGIEAVGIAGSIDAQTDSGGLQLAQTTPGAVRARSDSGGADIRLVRSAGYDVKASSDSGHVSVSDITVHGTISRHHAEGKVRGGGPLVDVSVGSGHVTID